LIQCSATWRILSFDRSETAIACVCSTRPRLGFPHSAARINRGNPRNNSQFTHVESTLLKILATSKITPGPPRKFAPQQTLRRSLNSPEPLHARLLPLTLRQSSTCLRTSLLCAATAIFTASTPPKSPPKTTAQSQKKKKKERSYHRPPDTRSATSLTCRQDPHPQPGRISPDVYSSLVVRPQRPTPPHQHRNPDPANARVNSHHPTEPMAAAAANPHWSPTATPSPCLHCTAETDKPQQDQIFIWSRKSRAVPPAYPNKRQHRTSNGRPTEKALGSSSSKTPPEPPVPGRHETWSAYRRGRCRGPGHSRLTVPMAN